MRNLLLFLIIMFTASPSAAMTYENKPLEAQIEALFVPGRDPLDVKIAIDQLSGGTAGNTKIEVDHMTKALRGMTADAQTEREKLDSLKRFLYVAGWWNGGKAFVYDHADPKAQNPVNRLLGHYVETRLGNCVTMPVLFMILGKRIGLNMTLAQAPLHILVKYTDETSAIWNLEPTSGGGFTRDEWYRRTLPMSDEAISNGIYLRPLSDDESVAFMAVNIVEHFLKSGRPEDAIVTADILLRHNPRDAHLLAKRGSAFYLILKRDVIERYPHQSDLTPEIKAYGDELYAQNQAAFAAAESLGWRQSDGQQ